MAGFGSAVPEDKQRRKPWFLLRLPGWFLLRIAERQFMAVLFHEPPRMTRCESLPFPNFVQSLANPPPRGDVISFGRVDKL